MAYVFRIHEPKKAGAPAPVSAATMSGWSPTGYIAGNLLSNITLGLNGNKMGTSIPSIFARIFLFEGAFQTLNGQNLQTLQSVTTDTKLVSECLDLIEFLYQHGNDPQLVIKRWSAQTQIAGLRSSNFDEHKKLAKVLEDEINLKPNLSEIFLFYWKSTSPKTNSEKEFLIGGTSPYTMVFTSPNWRTIIESNNFSFSRLNGTPMFSDSSIQSLMDRDSPFKNMMYSLHMAFNVQMSNQAKFFDNYLAQMMANDNPGATVAGMASNQGAFIAKYSNLTDENGVAVNCPIVPISYEKVTPTASDYEIVATASRFRNYTANDGSRITLNNPLVLNENGLGEGASYIGNSKWDINRCAINEAHVRTSEMHKRKLPGQMGVEYPYLIWSDFLEDKIIKLPYSQDSDKFITACEGEAKYVLPLKRNFFKYFNVEDISSVIPGTNRRYVEVLLSNNDVTITINVPVKSQTHKFIPLKRTYRGENIIDKVPFLLGFFPFYKDFNSVNNRYSVLKCGGGINLRFFNIDQLDTPLAATSLERTPQGTITSQTEYYTIRSPFDIVEVSSGNVHGVIIPNMPVKGNGTNHYKFAIDFGTSNTYIAHTTSLVPDPETLEVDAHDQQTVFLTSQTDQGPKLNAMRSHIAREFVPVTIGVGTNVSYPSRTATCEIPTFENHSPELFGTISVGYNLMNEPQALTAFSYKTGLKWLLEQHPGDTNHTNRVKYYFLQTLWTLKNESYLNDGDDSFDVYITFPETMKAPTVAALMGLWSWAKQELNLNCTFYYGTNYSESIAPYNCLAAQIGGSSYLNIDIGGGTNDLLFVLKDAAGRITNAHYSSSMFAGDDLWGDGTVIANTYHVKNGFVEYLVGSVTDKTGILGNSASFPADVISTLKALLGGVTKSSADIMGYLFKYDNVFQTSAKIQGCRNLYSIVFIHYAAILYNVARLINKLNIPIPNKLSFTGMGSKYLNLISSDSSVLKALTVLLLEKYTKQEVPRTFEIINPTQLGYDVKEITAKGILVGLGIGPGFQIPAGSLSAVQDLGFDTSDTITYNEVSNDIIRESAMTEFNKFVNSLKDVDFTNFLFQRFGLSISSELLDDLMVRGEGSFVTMSANVPAMFGNLTVQETLFFWPLKNSLIEIAKNYKIYQ